MTVQLAVLCNSHTTSIHVIIKYDLDTFCNIRSVQPILLANCSLLSSPYFAQNFASKFGQGLYAARVTVVAVSVSLSLCLLPL